MSDWYDWYNSRKMWIAGIVGVVMDFIALVQVVAADEAITFGELEGLKVAGILAIGTLLQMFGVYQAKINLILLAIYHDTCCRYSRSNTPYGVLSGGTSLVRFGCSGGVRKSG